MTSTDTVALLRIATDITSSNLNPEYAAPTARELSACITAHDSEIRVAAVANQLEAYADGVGLAGATTDLDADADLATDLRAWAATLREIGAGVLTPAVGDLPKPLRDPKTGQLNFALSIDVHLTGDPMGLTYDAADWKAVGRFLASAPFREIADRVEFVTITNRDNH